MEKKLKSFFELEKRPELAQPFDILLKFWAIPAMLLSILWPLFMVGIVLWAGFDFGLSVASSESLKLDKSFVAFFLIDSWVDSVCLIATLWMSPQLIFMWFDRWNF